MCKYTTVCITAVMSKLDCCLFAGEYDAEGIITPEAYLRHAKAWRAAGASIIGGCCGVGPQHMKLIADMQQLGQLNS